MTPAIIELQSTSMIAVISLVRCSRLLGAGLEGSFSCTSCSTIQRALLANQPLARESICHGRRAGTDPMYTCVCM